MDLEIQVWIGLKSQTFCKEALCRCAWVNQAHCQNGSLLLSQQGLSSDI